MLEWTSGALFIIVGALAFGDNNFADQSAAETLSAPVKSVCELKTARKEGPVSVMTGAYYDFEYGYFLSTPSCKDPVDGTGVLEIKLPPGKSVDDFPELAKLSSRSWLGASVGKRVNFLGTGQISFVNVDAEFTLRSVERVWASSD